MISSDEMLPANSNGRVFKKQPEKNSVNSVRKGPFYFLTFSGFVDGFEFLFCLVNSSGLGRRKKKGSETLREPTVMWLKYTQVSVFVRSLKTLDTIIFNNN